MKKIILLFLIITISFNVIPICADDDVENQYYVYTTEEKNNAIDSVLNSVYYKNLKSEFSETMDVKKLTETDYGEVYTVVLKSASDSNYGYLLFVENEHFSIIECIKSEYIDPAIKIQSLTSGEEKLLVNDASYARSTYCRTWTCTKYDHYSGSFSAVCAGAMGGLCANVASITKLGGLVCSAGIVLACYAPPYKICAKGVWKPVCAL